MKFWKNWKKTAEPAAIKPLAKLHIIRMDYPIESDCHVCLEWRECLHYDRDFIDMVCPGCVEHVRDAEIQLRAFIVEGMSA